MVRRHNSSRVVRRPGRIYRGVRSPSQLTPIAPVNEGQIACPSCGAGVSPVTWREYMNEVCSTPESGFVVGSHAWGGGSIRSAGGIQCPGVYQPVAVVESEERL